MLGIKYLAKKENWLYKNMTKECKTKIGKALQLYIFNDLVTIIVHIGIMIIFGILSNFINESLMINLMLYIGLIPFLGTMLVYIIAAIVNPINSLIKKWWK